MTYMLLVIEKPGDRSARSEQQGRALYDRMRQFGTQLKQRGLLTMSQALKSDSTAARVSAHGGRPVVHDGPFAEAKEMVGGFFLLSCTSREEALQIAQECPAVHWATIEVRELGPCFQ
jgi:hypothetical protein